MLNGSEINHQKYYSIVPPPIQSSPPLPYSLSTAPVLAKMRFSICLSVIFACAQISPLIETYELRSLLDSNSTLYLLEVIGLGESKDLTQDSRIPSAVYINLKEILETTALPSVKPLKTEAFTHVMMTYGLKADESLVVVYDAKGMRSAAMVWWIMRLYGKANVKVLNGGLPKWLREANPSVNGGSGSSIDPSQEDPSLYPYVLESARLWTCMDLVSYETYPDPMPHVQVVDVRLKNEFDLKNIAGSINMPADIIDRADGTIRTAIELKSIFEDYGVTTGAEKLTVVISKRSIAAARVLLALTILGKENGVILEGGWEEYRICASPEPSEIPSSPEPEPSPAPSVPEPLPAAPSDEPDPSPVPEPTAPSDDSPEEGPTPPVVTPPATPTRLLSSQVCVQDPSLPKSACFASDLPTDFSPIPEDSEAATQFAAFYHCTLACSSMCAVGKSSGQDCTDRCAFHFCFPSPTSSLQYPIALTVAALAVCVGYIGLKPGQQGRRECREHLLTK